MGKCLFMRKGEVHTAPSAGILASDLAVGSTVKLMENGVAAEYLVVNQGIPSNSNLYDASCDGTWLLRKDCYENRKWHSSNVNDYANSTIHSYLNGAFLELFDSTTQNTIKQVKIPYHNGNGSSGSVASGTSGLSAKVFLLGGYEVGFTQLVYTDFPIDGAKLDYFISGGDSTANEKRIAYFNGTATEWFLRSPLLRNTQQAWAVGTTGSYTNAFCTRSDSIRPALVLPSNAMFDAKTLIFKGVA